jgi:hypothetical protein
MASLAIVARISAAAKDHVPTGTRVRRRDQCWIQSILGHQPVAEVVPFSSCSLVFTLL